MPHDINAADSFLPCFIKCNVTCEMILSELFICGIYFEFANGLAIKASVIIAESHALSKFPDRRV